MKIDNTKIFNGEYLTLLIELITLNRDYKNNIYTKPAYTVLKASINTRIEKVGV